MATLQGSISFDGGYTLSSGDINNTLKAYGCMPSPGLTWSSGNGSGAANEVYWSNFSIGAGNAVTYSLIGANGELGALNNDLSMASVKLVTISLDTPVAGKQVAFGPQSVANSTPLWFANGTTGNETIRDSVCHVNRLAAGWSVSNVTHNITITNTGNVTANGSLLVVGVSN